MTSAQAIAAGLIDPEVARLIKLRTQSVKKSPRLAGTGETREGPNTCGSPKKKRSRSRPASHPKNTAGPRGSGSVELLATGEICAADLVFDVVPVPKERAQIVKNPKTDAVFGFTPARTKHFHEEIRRVVHDVMQGRDPIAGPVRLDMTFIMQIPASWPKWKKAVAAEGLIVPTGRPDMDNLEKALLDAFNRILIVDDAFVIERVARKIYGDMPAILARVEQTGQFDIHAKREAVEIRRRLLEEKNDRSDPA